MNTKRLILISALALFGSLVLSACSGQLSNNWNGLAADAERAYISGGSFVYAVDLKTGKRVWQFPDEAENYLFYADPVLTDDGQLLVGSAGAKDHFFFSLDAETGKETWAEPFSKNKGVWLASPLVFDDKIYAPNADGFLYVMDLKGNEASDPIELGGALWSAPVTDGSLLYVTSLDHHLHIVNPVNMSDKSVDLGGAAPGSPTVAEGGVYVGSFNSTVQFITPAGQTKPVAEAEDWIWGSPVLAGSTLYYADLNGNVFSMDIESGKSNWVVPQKDDAVVAGLVVVEDRIYVAVEGRDDKDGKLLALDLDGNVVWERNPGGDLYATPVVSGDLILVAPYQADYILVAYDKDGKQVWTPFTPEK